MLNRMCVKPRALWTNKYVTRRQICPPSKTARGESPNTAAKIRVRKGDQDEVDEKDGDVGDQDCLDCRSHWPGPITTARPWGA